MTQIKCEYIVRQISITRPDPTGVIIITMIPASGNWPFVHLEVTPRQLLAIINELGDDEREAIKWCIQSAVVDRLMDDYRASQEYVKELREYFGEDENGE